MSGTQKQLNIAPLMGSTTSISVPATLSGVSSFVTLNYFLPGFTGNSGIYTGKTFTPTGGSATLTLNGHGLTNGDRVVASNAASGFNTNYIYVVKAATANTIELSYIKNTESIIATATSGIILVRIPGDWSYCTTNGINAYQVPIGKKLAILQTPTPMGTSSSSPITNLMQNVPVLGYSDNSTTPFIRVNSQPTNEVILTPEWSNPTSAAAGSWAGAIIPEGKYPFIKYGFSRASSPTSSTYIDYIYGTFYGVLVDA